MRFGSLELFASHTEPTKTNANLGRQMSRAPRINKLNRSEAYVPYRLVTCEMSLLIRALGIAAFHPQ